nr:VOC family protein [Kibdelosporangium sp. MJ126-NF4]CEL17526.1 hypothetical protein [Kibdelosporangium sp. MJ126-NF4]CTQ91248.1 hypothetical protein [Kibdelosporangium sp. MJ126-NF4]
MTLMDARAEARLPAQDLERARRWYAEKLGLYPREERPGGLRYETATGAFCLFTSTGVSRGEFTQLALTVDDIEAEVRDLRSRGVEFEQVAIPGLPVTGDIVDIDDNYPSKGRAERGAFFRDCEGNLIALGQAVG